MTRRRGGWVCAWAVAAALGCDPQVGDQYAGEPLLSLQGNVVLSEEQASTDLVPQLAFREDEVVVLVAGEVSGEFPAKFRFDVMEPPPAGVIHTDWVPSVAAEVGSAQAVLVMLPVDYPRQFPERLEKSRIYQECSRDDATCTHIERACDAAGRCRDRLVECTDQPCTLAERLAAGWVPPPEMVPYRSSHACDAEDCYLVESGCDAAGDCFTDVYQCAAGQYGESETMAGGWMRTCSMLAESGDTSLVSYRELGTVAVDYRIDYVTHDVPDYGIERGYNLVWAPKQSLEEWLEELKCQESKTAEVVAEYNTEHGTNYHPFGIDGEVEDLAVVAWEEECDLELQQVVEHPFDELLTLKLGDPHLPD